MKEKYCYVLLSWFLLFVPVLGLGQDKFEREFGVDPVDFPRKARSFAEDGPFDRKIRWLKEKSQDGITYEIKTKYNRRRYSIEFDTTGRVIDVEKTIRFRRIEKSLKRNLEDGLQKAFTKYKITKTQVQWKADDKTLLQLIQTGQSENIYELHYEIVVKAKKDGARDFFEVLLTPAGEVIRVSKIVYRPSQNLEF